MKTGTRLFFRFILLSVLLLSLLFTASCLDVSTLPENPGKSQNGTNDPATDEPDDPGEEPTGGDTYYTVRFFKDGSPLGDGQSVKAGNRILSPDYSLTDDVSYSYEMLGWDADGDGSPEVFPYTVTENTVFHLLYVKTEKKYTVEIFDRDKLLSTAQLPYGAEIEYPTIVSFIDGEDAYIFRGWSYDGAFDGYLYPYVTKSVRIDAVYADGQILKLYFGGYLYAAMKSAGDSLDFSADFGVRAEEGKVLRYYTDDAFLTPFTGTFMPEGNLALYAREESNDPAVPTVHVASREELLRDFAPKLINCEPSMSYAMDYSETDLNELLVYLQKNSESFTGYLVSSRLSDKILTLEMTYEERATKTSGEPQYRQIESLNVQSEVTGRSAVFDDFASDKREVGFPVKNSDALYYALEHGYRPEIDNDEKELIALYNTMKIFLRTAVSDGMTDMEKARAIYEKLILDTVYDETVLEMMNAGQTGLTAYRAFTLEGVFIDKLAVCDGISKAFSSLCAMESIDCIRVSGKTKDGGPHAWNKVKSDGKWYVVDATAGGTVVGTDEVLTYAFFLRSDLSYSMHATENGTDYPNIHATEDYGFYDDLTVNIGDGVYHLTIKTAEEGGALLRSVVQTYPLSERSLDVRLDMGMATEDAVRAIINAAGITVSLYYAESLDSVILIFNS